ncbi:MAG: alpha/beta hydrolase [Bacteroidetes bacterium]|nr:MAG: alpha/beta hydrolase [Bacteroidota bacterium]
MKKILLSVITFFAFFLFGSAQTDFEKLQMEYEKLVNDPKNIYGKNKEAGKYYDIRGFKMYAEVYGEGQPLLFIHGNGGSINHFTYQIPYFSKKYKVIIADSRAQGNSKDNKDSITYEMMADDYAALLEAMKIDSAYVVGWSDGGINGLLLAIHHPEKVKKLAITGANLRPDTTAVPQSIWDLVYPIYNELKNIVNKNEAQKNALKMMRLLSEQPHIPLTDLHKISCPTLVIGGDHDVIKEEHTMEIYKNIPKSYLWILPNSGHSTPIVYADEFNKKIDDFFKQPFRSFDAAKRFF